MITWQQISTLAHVNIIVVVDGVGITVDEKNWAGRRGLFTQDVEVDYTSLMAVE